MRPAFSSLAALGLLLTTIGIVPALAQDMDPLAAQSDEDMAPSMQPQGPRGDRRPARPPRATARLASTQFPTIWGEAILLPGSEGRTAVTVTVYGLEPGSTHVNHIHNGSCTGPILFPLRDLIADERGVARSVSTVPAPIDADTWWVNTHGWESLPSPGITCGKVEMPPPPPPPPPAPPARPTPTPAAPPAPPRS